MLSSESTKKFNIPSLSHIREEAIPLLCDLLFSQSLFFATYRDFFGHNAWISPRLKRQTPQDYTAYCLVLSSSSISLLSLRHLSLTSPNDAFWKNAQEAPWHTKALAQFSCRPNQLECMGVTGMHQWSPRFFDFPSMNGESFFRATKRRFRTSTYQASHFCCRTRHQRQKTQKNACIVRCKNAAPLKKNFFLPK